MCLVLSHVYIHIYDLSQESAEEIQELKTKFDEALKTIKGLDQLNEVLETQKGQVSTLELQLSQHQTQVSLSLHSALSLTHIKLRIYYLCLCYCILVLFYMLV